MCQVLNCSTVEKDVQPHSGKYCFGKTPMQTFMDSIPLAKAKMLNNTLQTQEQTEDIVCQVK